MKTPIIIGTVTDKQDIDLANEIAKLLPENQVTFIFTQSAYNTPMWENIQIDGESVDDLAYIFEFTVDLPTIKEQATWIVAEWKQNRRMILTKDEYDIHGDGFYCVSNYQEYLWSRDIMEKYKRNDVLTKDEFKFAKECMFGWDFREAFNTYQEYLNKRSTVFPFVNVY